MLLRSRITKPKYVEGIIERPRLYQQLDRWLDYRVILIQAPAGYGKSTLVSRWIDVSSLDGNYAWLSLGEDDNDSRQFLTTFAAALDTCLPGLLETVKSILLNRQYSPQEVLTRLLTVLEEDWLLSSSEASRHILLVLDDLQCINSVEVNTLIHRVLEFGPNTLRLVLLTRHLTGLSLARFFAHGVVTEINKEDMRFAQEEIFVYLQRHGYSNVSPGDVTQLTNRSEGWVTALHLAILSSRQPGDISELLRALRGDQHWLAEFLTDELLDRQRAEIRLFLLQTSILDGFNASLCAAVTGLDDAASKLAEIIRADLFLINLGSDNWFRYHHLFQELLQNRLVAQMDVGTVADLHRRAATWLASHDQMTPALRHLLAAGDEAAAADLLESRMRRLIVRDYFKATRLFDLLPKHIWQQRPQLVLDRAFLALVFDDQEIKNYVQQAAELLNDPDQIDEITQAQRGELLVLQSGFEITAKNISPAANYAQQAEAYFNKLDHLAAGTLCFIDMHLYRNEGEQAKMRQWGEEAQALFERADFAVGSVAIRRQLGSWSMFDGKAQEATEHFQMLFNNIPRDRPEILRELIIAYIIAAENCYWQNNLEQARYYQQLGLDLGRKLQDSSLIYCGHRMGTILDYNSDRFIPDIQLNNELLESASRGEFGFLIDFEIRYLSLAGSIEDAWKLAQTIGIDPENTDTASRHRLLIAYLRAYIARGRDLSTATPLLAGGLAYHTTTDNRFRQLQLLTLTAWQQLKLYGAQAANAALTEAIRLARETGYVRVLLDIPELTVMVPELNDTLDLSSRKQLVGSKGVDLTEREQEVLQLLSFGYTYQEIGVELSISINTVRTYVRHIYKKLSVNKRVQAIAAARRLGYLKDNEAFTEISQTGMPVQNGINTLTKKNKPNKS